MQRPDNKRANTSKFRYLNVMKCQWNEIIPSWFLESVMGLCCYWTAWNCYLKSVKIPVWNLVPDTRNPSSNPLTKIDTERNRGKRAMKIRKNSFVNNNNNKNSFPESLINVSQNYLKKWCGGNFDNWKTQVIRIPEICVTCHPWSRRLRSTILNHMTASAAWKLFNRRHRRKRKMPKQRSNSEVEAWTTVFLVLTLVLLLVLVLLGVLPLFWRWTLVLWFLEVGGFSCTWGRWFFSTLTKWMPFLWSICGTERVNGGRTDDLAVRSVGSK